MFRLQEIEQALSHIGIPVREKDGDYRTYLNIVDDIVDKWNELNYDQKQDLADVLLD